MQLTNAEEQVMKFLWKLEKAYMKNILEEFPDPRPATTTIATLLKRMIDKGFVGYNQHGSNREYFPLVQKSDYFARNINTLIKDFFNNSATQFASFFTNETNLSLSELEDLKKIVEKKIENHKK
ncbi:MAG TPA: penicillinase repressor [Prolixibacteraceae bacterium]|jgi:predicted transcriptional regulator|nr:penicillinase repressor [Prolixibacteraceae bacterium]